MVILNAPPPCGLSLLSTAEAIHLGSLVAAHGYVFPISDHVLTLKDDGTLYRFQVQEAPPCVSLVCVGYVYQSLLSLLLTPPRSILYIPAGRCVRAGGGPQNGWLE